MKQKRVILRIEGTDYPCLMSWRRMSGTSYRISRDGKNLSLGVPFYFTENMAKEAAAREFPKLIARYQKRVKPLPYEGDEVYLLGEKRSVEGFAGASEEERDAFYKRILLPYVKAKTEEWREKMGIKTPYKVIVRTMTSRYGVNSSKTKRISYATNLVHYAPEIIDSVIIHELAHDKERNHGDRFYKIVFAYCPNYKALRHKLIRGEYQ